MTDDSVWGYDWVRDVETMSRKFGVRETVASFDRDRLVDFVKFRLDLLREEFDEAVEAVASGSPEDVVDAMVDLCVVAIGTLEAVGADSRRAWREVMRANMAKETGIKPGRPNPLGLPDLIKPSGWVGPSHAGNVGDLGRAFGGES